MSRLRFSARTRSALRRVTVVAVLVLPLLSVHDDRPKLAPTGGVDAPLFGVGQRPPAAADTHDGAQVAGVSRAGGAAVVHRPGGQALPRQPRWVGSMTVRSISVDVATAEPTIGVASDGVVYAQLWGDDAVPSVARSDDEGRTWRVIRPGLQATDLTRSHDPYLHVDTDTGRVFTANLTSGPGVCHEIAFTDDHGRSWTPTALCVGGDHQTLFTGPPVASVPSGYPNLVYYCLGNNGIGGHGTVHTSCFVSRDGGVTFLPTGDQAFVGIDADVEHGQYGVPGFCDGLTGHGTVGPDGTVFLPRIHCDRPMLAISRDEGLTWERVQVGPPGTAITHYAYHSHDAGIAADVDGTLYYTWVGRDRLPYLVVSTDDGHSWSDPIMVAHPDLTETSLPGAIEVVAPGRVALAYVGSEDSPGPPFPELVTCTSDPLICADQLNRVGTSSDPPGYEDVTWHGYVTIIDGAPAGDPLLVSARVTPHDQPLVTGACGPFRCKGLYDFMDVAVAPDGDVWGVFVDDCAHDVDGDGDGDACQDTFGRLLLGELVGAGAPMECAPGRDQDLPAPRCDAADPHPRSHHGHDQQPDNGIGINSLVRTASRVSQLRPGDSR